jgi:SRSO17 transposase
MLPFFAKEATGMVAERQADELLARAEVEGWQAGLDTLHDRIAGRFRRPEVRERARRYLRGLVAAVARKNGWHLAEHLGERGPQGVQRLLNAARWDADAVRDDLQDYVVEAVGDREGVLIVDETGFLKKGTKSVGVQRQYSGTAGRIENCQIGVFLAYGSPRGRAFLDRELYLPQEWASDADRRTEAGVPEAVAFATKPALAQGMLSRAFAAEVPAAWVTADTVYGDDGALRYWLEEQDHAYVLAVSATHPVWQAGQQRPTQAVIADLPDEAWTTLSAGEGSQGPRLYDWARLRLPDEDRAGMASWLLARRSRGDATELAYYRAFGPEETGLADLARVAGTRWVIEESLERAKGSVGLDQYEVRRWLAWYRQMTLALLAHAYLEVTRAGAVAAAGSDQKGDRPARGCP